LELSNAGVVRLLLSAMSFTLDGNDLDHVQRSTRTQTNLDQKQATQSVIGNATKKPTPASKPGGLIPSQIYRMRQQ